MPRLKNALPSYRKHRASGQAVVTLSGVDRYLGRHGTKASRTLYDRLVAEWLASGRKAAAADAATLSVVELCSRYLRFAKGYYVKNGRCTGVVPGIKAAIKYLRTWYGKEPAVAFGPVALKALRQRMVDDGLSRSYVNDHVKRIKRIFKWAAGEELVPESTFRALTLVEGLRAGRSKARETAPVVPVDDATVEATLGVLSSVVGDMVRVQRLTGMRPAEICALRPCDLDRTADVWTYQPSEHKTEHHGRARTIYVGPKAQGGLLRYLARDPEAFCFAPRDAEAKRLAAAHAARKTPLSCGNRPGSNRKRGRKRTVGTKYTVDSYRRAIHRACDKAGIERWSPNRLRHAAATEVRTKFGLEAAQVILGHASADVTQVYAERDAKKGAEVARLIG